MFIVTIIARDSLSDEGLVDIEKKLAEAGCAPQETAWLDKSQAVDIYFQANPEAAQVILEECAASYAVDCVVQPAPNRMQVRRKQLLIADMDSTMIRVETLDELADYAGLKEQIAEITERAMAGKLDFVAALTERVALLRGLSQRCIEDCLAERVVATHGARAVVQTMRAHGARTVLVSGGFDCFAEAVAAQLGFDRVVANRLDIVDGRLAGTIAAPIVTAASKLAVLDEECTAMAIDRSAVLAVGDGANDSEMLSAAGLGLAYRPHPVAAQAANAAIHHYEGLHPLLWAQGYSRSQWVA